MNKAQFKKRWESNDNGDGITFDDIANCYTAWGLGGTPRIKPLEHVRYTVLKAAGTNDAEEFNPANEEDIPPCAGICEQGRRPCPAHCPRNQPEVKP